MILTVKLTGVIVLIVAMGTLFGLHSSLEFFLPLATLLYLPLQTMALKEFLELENVIFDKVVFLCVFDLVSLWQGKENLFT